MNSWSLVTLSGWKAAHGSVTSDQRREQINGQITHTTFTDVQKMYQTHLHVVSYACDARGTTFLLKQFLTDKAS